MLLRVILFRGSYLCKIANETRFCPNLNSSELKEVDKSKDLIRKINKTINFLKI